MFVFHGYLCGMKAFQKYPNEAMIKIQQGPDVYFTIAKDKEMIKEVLIRKYRTVGKGEFLAPVGLFGPNVFSADSNNPLWKKHRTLSNPIFSNVSHLRNVFRVTMEELPKMIQFWTKYYDADKNGNIRNVNTTQELKSVTLTVINRVAFDYDIEIFDKTPEHRDEVHGWISDLLTGLMYKFVFPEYLFEIVPFGIFKRFKDAKNRFRDTAMTMVLKKTKEAELDHQVKDDEDLLSLLLKSANTLKLSEEERLSNDELVSAIFIIFFAGFETSSTSLNFMLRLLATNPEIQEKLIEEIDRDIPSLDSIKFEDITEKLPYLTSFMKEAFRVKIPVGGATRVITKKGGETVGGQFFEEGTVVNVGLYAQHKLSHNNAMDDFKFDRFFNPEKIETEEDKMDKGTMGNLSMDFQKDELITFSIGPRDCLGRRMALLEIKLILVYLLKQYRIKVPEHLKEQQAKIKETYIVTRTVLEPYIFDYEKRN
ncbi:cytochrome P450-domain-containing protein [Naegleria gruberi]|uniref:Cytochrome P450-domain-containing protein n=1 Tax=Naegleria gruberi TaxID=5762 RepID=D2VQY8_NAEGR|nr:cytochrome P450-domain-containing protein [Naegleria gruberi]EFC40795.1 cytochrome P450-domain-containing protein [Naegleria gruberi]|eukprot:XP_002673539.1 cytochrome P450-domain-containing protein [Naegleria gruberi strain NEG-M]